MKGRKIPSGESYSLRLPPELVLAARDLGRGNVAEGIRRALRIATRVEVKPPLLSTVLRGLAYQADELELQAGRRKAAAERTLEQQRVRRATAKGHDRRPELLASDKTP